VAGVVTLRRIAGRTAIVKQLEKLVREGKKTRLTRIVGRDLLRAKSSDLAEAAALGDAVVMSVLDRTARYLAIESEHCQPAQSRDDRPRRRRR
jgi:predicted NBD/HSP70 family sugar kinase